MDLDAARRLWPLLTPAGLRQLERVRQHAQAPRWTHLIGDHATAEDLAALDAFRAALAAPRAAHRAGPPDPIVEWVARTRARVPLWQERIPQGFALARDWAFLPTTRREDLAAHLDLSVPEDEPTERLIVYETSGTTGHALRVPHHPRAVAMTHALAELALGWHGAAVRRGPEAVACMNLRAQASVWVYPSVFSAWGEAGFARLNLNPHAWAGGAADARRFIEELDPGLLTGDPGSFAELLRLGVAARPAALLSTAVTLDAPLADALAARYRCPLLDWYSTTETGPIACSRPGGPGMALLAHDLYVELLDADGLPVPEGERGEVAVTGGRNPFLPLLRYRTGDTARLVSHPDGPRLVDLEGRAAVTFRATDGSPVNPVDVGRALRHDFAVVQHEFLQRGDGSLAATLRPAWGLPLDPARVEAALQRLFGAGARVEVRVDDTLGLERKVVPYRREAPPEAP